MPPATEQTSPPTDSAEAGMLKADRGLRIRLLLFLALFSVLGTLVIFGLERHLEKIVAASEDNPEQAVREVFRLLRLSAGVGGAGLLVFGLYFTHFSLKVLSSGQFPPPGTKVVRDTRVQTGPAARLRAGAGIALATLLIVLGLAVPWIPDLLIRPLIYQQVEDAEGEASPSPDAPLPAPDHPEQHAALYPFLPGGSETGPGPRSASRFSTSS